MSKSRRISNRTTGVKAEFEQMVSLAEQISAQLEMLEKEKKNLAKRIFLGIFLLVTYIILGIINFFVSWITLGLWPSIFLSVAVIGIALFYLISPTFRQVTEIATEAEIDRRNLETLEQMIIDHQKLAFASMSDIACLLMEIRLGRIRFEFPPSIINMNLPLEEE